jgi:hypothetical protein
MLKYGINNIKLLFESDMRVLKQIDDKDKIEIKEKETYHVSTIKLVKRLCRYRCYSKGVRGKTFFLWI